MCANCIFCEKSYLYERIIAETNNYYVVATLGQISNGGYLLPIPKNHVPCIAQIVSPEPFNIASLTDRLSAIIRAEYGCVPLIFEHGIVGKTINHAVVVTGIDEEKVYINDPDETRGGQNSFLVDHFITSIAVAENKASNCILSVNR